MPIEVRHAPVAAQYELATRAGQAEAMNIQKQQDDRLQLMELEQGNKMQALAFQQRAQSEAMAEEYAYQTQLTMTKRQIDMDIETAQYARQKQDMTAALNMISGSNEFNDREKDELKMQAMAKFAGVGTGITPGSTAASTLEKQLTLGAHRTNMIQQVQDQVKNNQMEKWEGEQYLAGQGITGAKLYSAMELESIEASEGRKRLSEAQKALDDTGMYIEDGDLKNEYGDDIERGSSLWQTYTQLEEYRNTMADDLASIHEEKVPGGERSMTDFLRNVVPDNDYLTTSIQMYGEEKTYRDFYKLTGGVKAGEQKPQGTRTTEQRRTVQPKAVKLEELDQAFMMGG